MHPSSHFHKCRRIMFSIGATFLVFVTACFQISNGRRLVPNHSHPEERWSDNSFRDDRQIRRKLFTTQQLKSEDHLVTSLPGLNVKDLEFNQYAGNIMVDSNKGGHLFYWLFESKKEDAANRPLIIWLNGGPGCSSMDGLWLELGPLRLNDDQTVRVNANSWHKIGNIVFIDQPVGTGFAYTLNKDGYAKNDETINSHFYTFLMTFFEIHSQYTIKEESGGSGILRSVPIFFTGESHAGHYIPSMVNYILQRNNDANNLLQLNVEGIALGNPWLDPSNQYNPAEFAHGLGILSSGQVNKLSEQEGKCKQLLKQGRLNSNICYSLLDSVIDASTLNGAAKVLMYDTRKYVQSSRSFPPGHEALERYLNRADVQTALHVKNFKMNPNANNNIKYVECADPPYNALAHQDGKGVVTELVNILSTSQIRVLIFAGQYDLICNHLNLEKALDSLKWSGQEDWKMKTPGVWLVNKKPAGYSRSHSNLQFLVVLDSGHMVPMDQPEIAFTMIKTFIENKAISSGESKIGVSSSSQPTLSGEETTGGTSDHLLDSGVICPISTSVTATSRLLSSIVPANNLGQGVHSQSDQSRSSHVFHYHPVIVHGALASEDVAFLRLKIQHSGTVGNHHANAVPGPRISDQQSQYFILIQPGRKCLDISFSWFHNSNAHVDVLIENLVPGTEYQFNIDKLTTNALSENGIGGMSPSTHHLPHAAKRVVSLKIGCYHDEYLPCCGHGECIPYQKNGGKLSAKPLVNNSRSVCNCDTGYEGDNCDHYHISDHSSGKQIVVHGHENERDVALCPNKLVSMRVNSAMAKHFQFHNLPTIPSPLETVGNSMHPNRGADGDVPRYQPSLPLSSSSASITDTVISFTEGCQGNCCVHVELSLELAKLQESLKENVSTITVDEFINDPSYREMLLSSLSKELDNVVSSSTVISSSPAVHKLSTNLIFSSKSKVLMNLPLYLSMCGDVDRVNTAVHQVSTFIARAKHSPIDGSPPPIVNALSSTYFHILSNPADVASMKALFSSDESEKDSQTPPLNVVGKLVYSNVDTINYSINSYVKYALVVFIVFCFVMSCSPSSSLWVRWTGTNKESAALPNGSHPRSTRKSSKA